MAKLFSGNIEELDFIKNYKDKPYYQDGLVKIKDADRLNIHKDVYVRSKDGRRFMQVGTRYIYIIADQMQRLRFTSKRDDDSSLKIYGYQWPEDYIAVID